MNYIVFGASYPMFASHPTPKNPFERAILEKNWRLLRTLIYSRNVNELTSDGSIPLIFFLRHSEGAPIESIVNMFLRRFSEIENVYVDDNGTHRASALLEMVGKGSVQLLLDYNANLNFQNDEGETALHRAIILNDTSNIKLLLERGARLDIPRDDGKTAQDLLQIQTTLYPLFWKQAH